MRARGEALGAKQQLLCDVCDTQSAGEAGDGAGSCGCCSRACGCNSLLQGIFCFILPLGVSAGVLASLRVWKPVLTWTETCSEKSSSVKVLVFSVWNYSDNGAHKCWDSSGVHSEVMCS